MPSNGEVGGFMRESDRPVAELLVEVEPVEVVRERLSIDDSPGTSAE